MSDPITRLNAALEGRYRIERELGEGGMATVYLADDLRHERKVALKVLKPELAAVVGAERFLAEIKTTANLQHPHILPLFDSGEVDSFLFYVMPYVEGESLRERLDRDHQLPVDEAVRIATNVAEALDYAHRQGVIHRDIKPANILLQDGKPVVSDFGIALAIGAAGAGRLTETGLSLGTPHYMSPEQATGDLNVGAATDIYALGCVVYEMLVGEPPFTGSTPQAVLGKIVTGDSPSVRDGRKSVPMNVDAALRRSLEKVPADRFLTAADFAAALGDPDFDHGRQPARSRYSTASRLRWVAAVGWSFAVASSIGFAWALGRPEPPRQVQRFASPFAPAQEPTAFGYAAFELSRDGSMVVYRGPAEGSGGQLWIRHWDNLESNVIRASAGGTYPSVSPDGREVVFQTSGSIIALALDGGPTRTLGEGDAPTWGRDGFVYFTREGDVVRVPAAGGAAEVLLSGNALTRFAVNDVLPGGGGLLLVADRGPGLRELRVLRPDGSESTLDVGNVLKVRYVDTGHLVYLSDGSEGLLRAAPFDLASKRLRGDPVTVSEGVLGFSLSSDGKLLASYGGGRPAEETTELIWFSRAGEVEPAEAGFRFARGRQNWGLSLSRDGRQVALRHLSPGGDVWIKEIGGGPFRRLTFDEGEELTPVWAADGEHILYASDPVANPSLWRVRANGTGAPERLLTPELLIAQIAVRPQGDWVILRTGALVSDRGARDLMSFRPGVDSVPVPLVASSQFAEQDPAFSPDGNWLAYSSDETGQPQVFVRSFPDVDGVKIQVSSTGGIGPRWAHRRRELYYLAGTDGTEIRSVSYQADPTGRSFEITGRTTLFTRPRGVLFGAGMNSYDVAPDDERFIFLRSVSGDDVAADPILVLTENFFEELERLVPSN